MQKLILAEMQEIATSHGGKCRSRVYVNRRTKLKWECGSGHKWEATPGAIKTGRWCPKCGRKRITAANAARKPTINDMKKIAQDRGGKCLSKQYRDNKTKLKWQCSQGHEWEANSNSIKSGSWCPVCAGSIKRTIAEMRSVAKQRGGKCLSTSYVSNRRKLLWQCKYGHQWTAAPMKVVNSGRWCPECASGLGERICRLYFEHLFEQPFPRSHPAWLRGKKDYPWELDGYSESLGLAFEHQGQQHYKKAYYQSERKFDELKRRDRRKRDICRRHGVVLIAIPEVPTLTPVADLLALLYKKLKRAKILPPKNRWDIPVDINEAYRTAGAEEQLEWVRQIAKERGGKCLAERWEGDAVKVSWECVEGHRWLAKPNSIKSGRWCLRCAGLERKTIEDMRQVAAQRGGECLSTKYENMATKLRWRCRKGHEWNAKPGNIINVNSWCPVCRDRKSLRSALP